MFLLRVRLLTHIKMDPYGSGKVTSLPVYNVEVFLGCAVACSGLAVNIWVKVPLGVL